MGIVYAKESTAVEHNGGALVIPRGTAYDDDHDIVKAHPEIFEGEPSRVAGRPTVERATRAPGERRGTRAPSQTAAEKKAAAAAKRKAAAEAKKAAAEEKAAAAAQESTADAGADDKAATNGDR